MKYYPPQFDSFEDYKKDCWHMVLFTWGACVFLIVAMAFFFYFGWKVAPWVIFGFLLGQNIPLAIKYTMRYQMLLEEESEE